MCNNIVTDFHIWKSLGVKLADSYILWFLWSLFFSLSNKLGKVLLPDAFPWKGA